MSKGDSKSPFWSLLDRFANSIKGTGKPSRGACAVVSRTQNNAALLKGLLPAWGVPWWSSGEDLALSLPKDHFLQETMVSDWNPADITGRWP